MRSVWGASYECRMIKKRLQCHGIELPRSAADCTRQYWVPNMICYLGYPPKNIEDCSSFTLLCSFRLFIQTATGAYYTIYYKIFVQFSDGILMQWMYSYQLSRWITKYCFGESDVFDLDGGARRTRKLAGWVCLVLNYYTVTMSRN